MLTDTLFENKKLNEQKLLDYGFKHTENGYIYSINIVENQFRLVITVSPDRNVFTKLTDLSNNEVYVLHLVKNAEGAFVGAVKKEYKLILNDIAEKCFDNFVFKSEYANQIITYIRQKYDNELEYLWKKFPNNAIWRRSDNQKWYGALLTVPKNKIGLTGDKKIEIIDLRAQPELIESLIDNKTYFPGYHMNKKHWFTICLDGSIAIEEIFRLIDNSYDLAKKK